MPGASALVRISKQKDEKSAFWSLSLTSSGIRSRIACRARGRVCSDRERELRRKPQAVVDEVEVVQRRLVDDAGGAAR